MKRVHFATDTPLGNLAQNNQVKHELDKTMKSVVFVWNSSRNCGKARVPRPLLETYSQLFKDLMEHSTALDSDGTLELHVDQLFSSLPHPNSIQKSLRRLATYTRYMKCKECIETYQCTDCSDRIEHLKKHYSYDQMQHMLQVSSALDMTLVTLYLLLDIDYIYGESRHDLGYAAPKDLFFSKDVAVFEAYIDHATITSPTELGGILWYIPCTRKHYQILLAAVRNGKLGVDAVFKCLSSLYDRCSDQCLLEFLLNAKEEFLMLAETKADPACLQYIQNVYSDLDQTQNA